MSHYPEFIKNVSSLLATDLPGQSAQMEMSIAGRRLNPDPERSPKRAAVLISLFELDNTWHTVVIRRKKKVQDRHSGQISFPGGRLEALETPEQAAIRESHEEVGTPLSDIRLLGSLTPLFISVSDFLVEPFVAYLPERPDFVPQMSEVDSIFEVPLHEFVHPRNKRVTDIEVTGGIRIKNVPHFYIQDQVVWGATAMIMNEFLAVLRDRNALNFIVNEGSAANNG